MFGVMCGVAKRTNPKILVLGFLLLTAMIMASTSPDHVIARWGMGEFWFCGLGVCRVMGRACFDVGEW